MCPPIEALLGAPGPGCVARPAVLDSNRSPYKGQPKNRPLWMARCLAMSRTADEGGTHTWWETSQLLRGQRGGEPAAATCHFEQNLARIKHILAGSGGQKSFVSGRQRFHENRAIKHNVTASPFCGYKRAASRSSGPFEYGVQRCLHACDNCAESMSSGRSRGYSSLVQARRKPGRGSSSGATNTGLPAGPKPCVDCHSSRKERTTSFQPMRL